jgi:peptidoglycan/LPS O-acetylase OafA/YrhL
MRDTAPTGRTAEHARVPALDLLRLVAVLLVAAFHFGLQGPAGLVAVPGVESIARYGFMGVPIFFVISGFVIAYSAEGRTATSFAIARISRIYPTFLLCMTLTFLAVYFFGAPHFQANFTQWAANLAIVAPGHTYIDSAYWSLAVEAVFYGWITVFIWFGLSIRRCDAILLLWIAISLLNELTVDIRFFGKTLMTDYSGFFASGILIYQMRCGKADARLRAILAVAVITGTYQAIHNLRWIRQETGADFDEFTVALIFLASVCIIFFATGIKRVSLNPTLLLALGGCTYPLYLLHQQLGYVAFMRMNGSAHPFLMATAIVFAIALVSLGIWIFFERPVQRWLRTFLAKAAARLAAKAKPSLVNS